MADATSLSTLPKLTYTIADAVAAGDLRQLGDGSAGVYTKSQSRTAGTVGTPFDFAGQYRLPKPTGINFLDGGRVYWNRTTRQASYKRASARDFYVGRCTKDAGTADVEVEVNLNADPRYDADLALDAFNTVLVGTPAAGGFGYPVGLGGARILELTGTSEAQKVDLLSVDGFAVSSNPVIECAWRILNDGSNATQDFTIGAASGTNASDFQSVAEFVAFSTVGNSTNINAQSDDGTTDVAPTDTTADYTEGSAQSNRVEGWIDCRDPDSCKFYVNGVRVLSATTFKLTNAAGPLFLIAHLEKTSGTDVYKVAVDWLRVRTAEQ